MFYDDHNLPQFHPRYGKNNVTIGIDSLRVIEGTIPHRVLELVMEWASQHQKELLANLELAKKNEPPKKIAPLA
jgi:Domain of unknown function (DUF4160)